MLKNIPPILSPELLKVLAEMGHSDRICLGDGNFPGARMAKAKNAIFLRADGHGVPELLEAILQVIPLDTYVDTPAMIMEVGEHTAHAGCEEMNVFETLGLGELSRTSSPTHLTSRVDRKVFSQL